MSHKATSTVVAAQSWCLTCYSCHLLRAWLLCHQYLPGLHVLPCGQAGKCIYRQDMADRGMHATACAEHVHACRWRLIEAAANVPGAGLTDPAVLRGQPYLDWFYGNAQKSKLNFVRFFGIADVDGGLQGGALQPSPGARRSIVSSSGKVAILVNIHQRQRAASVRRC